MPDIFDQLIEERAQQQQEAQPQGAPVSAQAEPQVSSLPVPAARPSVMGNKDIFDQLIEERAQGPAAAGVLLPEQTGEMKQGDFGWGEVVEGAFKNFFPDLGRSVVTTIKPFTSVENFIQTAKSLGSLAEGMLMYALPGEHPNDKLVEAVANHYGDRFLSLDGFKRAMRDNPASTAIDLAFLTKAAAGAVGKAAEIGGAAHTAEIAGRVGKAAGALNPLRVAGAVISKPIKLSGWLGKQILGNLITGKGSEAIQKAFDRPPEFVRALKGQISMGDVLRNARGGLHSMRENRAAEYTKDLAKIVAKSKDYKKPLNLAGIQRRLRDKLTGHGYRAVIDEEGHLDLSGSVFGEAAYSDVRRIYRIVNNWGKAQRNTTVLGFDALKRKLDDTFSPTSQSRALVSGLRNEVKQEIVKSVREYAKMTQKYEEASDIIHEIERGLALGDRVSMTTAVKRLTSTMKEKNSFRLELLNTLSRDSGVDFAASISGAEMRSLLPDSLVGRLADAGVGTSILYNGIAATDPRLFVGLLATSPRVLASFLNVLGKGYRGSRTASKGYIAAAPTLLQVGRVQGIAAREQPRTELEQ